MYDPNEYLREMVRKAEKEAERARAFADFLTILFFLVVLAAIPLAMLFA